MPQPVSAFAAYKANGNKKGANARKANNSQKKNHSVIKGRVTKANGGKAASTSKAASSSKAVKVPDKKAPKNSSTPRKTTAAVQSRKSGSAAKSSDNFLTPELEKYLIAQLEADDAEEEEEEEGEEEESTDYDNSSDFFTDEYTVNTTGSFTDYSSAEDDRTVDNNNTVGPTLAGDKSFSLDLLKEMKNGSQKRKTVVDNVVSNKKGNTKAATSKAEAKGAAAIAPKKATLEKNVRKSLPAVSGQQLDMKVESKNNSFTNMIVDEEVATTSAAAGVKIEPLSPPKDVATMNSIEEGKRAFGWLVHPIPVDQFFAKYWEKAPCFVGRSREFFRKLISFEMIDQMLRDNHIEFTKNIDITSYKNGIRETLNPDGRALPPAVWDFYGQGCSIRLLNPQTYLAELRSLNTTLQEYFRCMVGANAYLTPPNSQGFAPHFDDIEAFVLQIEGCKRWKVYNPRSKSETLPRLSSRNFSQEEIGKPIFEKVLKPGDLLYFPRGFVHQACTEKGNHSLHITLSVYQKQSYADLFEHMLPIMLQSVITKSVDLRRGVPLEIWQHAGVAYDGTDTKERAAFQKNVKQLFSNFMREVPLTEVLDLAVDQMAKKFQHEGLPPVIRQIERKRTIFGSLSRTNERGECLSDYDIDLYTKVRLLRANIMRLVKEENTVRVYHQVDNSKQYCEHNINFIEIEPFEAFSVEVLIKSYPAFISVSQLPTDSDERKIQIATALWERGLLMLENPLK